VRELVQMHGGTVTAQSAGRGHGSKFTVRLPASPASPAVAPGVGGSTGADREPDQIVRKTILVVDDNVDAADALAATLRLQGHVVEVAYDGRSALEMSERLAPQVVVLDIGMAGMDGYEVARQLRRRQPQARLIALTGWGQENDKRRALDAGFDSHLTKPADLDALQALVLG